MWQLHAVALSGPPAACRGSVEDDPDQLEIVTVLIDGWDAPFEHRNELSLSFLQRCDLFVCHG